MGLLSRWLGPPSPDQFAAMVLRRLKQAGASGSFAYDPPHFRLLLSEDGVAAGIVNLRNFYDEFCALPPADAEKWWSRTIRGKFSYRKQIPDDFADARPDLRPAVRTRSYIETMRLDAAIQGHQFVDVPHELVGDYLLACVVYDLPESMSYVNQEQLETWGVTFYEAMEVARANLEETEFNVLSIGDRVFAPVVGDAYDATRLLLMDRVRQMPLSGVPVAIAVNRDTLLIAGADDAEGLELLVDLTEKKQGEPRPLCAVPLQLDRDHWESWLPASDHPSFGRFKLLELKYLADEYGEQKRQLEQFNERRGVDEFVASFAALEVDGRLFSYAVWSRGVPTQLPKTDELFFFSEDPPVRLRCGWAAVAATVGPLLKPQDGYPARWFVDGFPSAEQFAAMGARPLES